MTVNQIYDYLLGKIHLLNKNYQSNLEFSLEGNSEIVYLCLLRTELNYIYKIRTLISYDHIENCNRISTPYFFINHLNVTEILFPILLKNERISYLSTLEDFFIVTPSLLEDKQKKDVVSIFNFSIKDNSDIDRFVLEINRFTEEYVEPFFTKWSNLEMILALIDNTSQLDFCEMVSYGAYVKPIVYKIMGRIDDYNDYMERFINYNKERAINDPSEIFKTQKFNASIELKESLDKI